jgi:hypothetical protein
MTTVGWVDVRAGDELSQGGELWQVERIDHQLARVRLTRLVDGWCWEGSPGSPSVERTRTADEVVHTAAAAVAPITATTDEWPPVSALKDFPDSGTIRAHLWIFHGTTAQEVPDDRDVAANLSALHDTLHTEPGKDHVAHQHLT